MMTQEAQVMEHQSESVSGKIRTALSTAVIGSALFVVTAILAQILIGGAEAVSGAGEDNLAR
jgi:hypothetical protein